VELTASIGIVTDFLRSIKKDVGRDGFEGLGALLLQAATGQEFRLSSSGRQRGRDASSESGYGNTIKLESKHVKRLDLRELLAEIDEAVQSDKALDIWALVTSSSVDDQMESALSAQGEHFGIDVLILDVGINGLPRLVTLIAAHPDVVIDWVARCEPAIDANRLREALTNIAEVHDIKETVTRLNAKLLGTAGYDSARRRTHEKFLATVADQNRARATFRQSLAVRSPDFQVVRRVKVSDALNSWWNGSNVPVLGIVLGEEGAGKTWATFDWLASQLENDPGRMPIILPFAAAATELSVEDPVDAMLPRLLARWTGLVDGDRWSRRLSRWLDTEPTGRPLILLVGDGLNERADINWVPFFNAILSDPWRQRIAVLATDRPRHWRDRCALAGIATFQEIKVAGYSDAEFSKAVSNSGMNYGQIPAELLPLISLPRYCALVIRHFKEMVAANDFTRERLIYLEVRDRRQSKVDYPLTDDRLFEIIRDLAEQARTTPDLNPKDLRALISTPSGTDAGIANIYEELIGGGILVESNDGGMVRTWSVEPTRLVFGFGMLLADELGEMASSMSSEIGEYLESWFEPQPDMDKKVEICGSALFHALFKRQFPEVALKELVSYWLNLRNWAETAQSAFTGYVARRPAVFLDITERFWSSEGDSGAAQEFLRTAFVANRDHPDVRPLLAESIERWMGFTHPSGRHPASQGAEESIRFTQDAEARARCALIPGLIEVAGTQLTVVSDIALLRLGRFGLLIMSAGDPTPFIRAVVNWAVASAVMDDGDYSELVSWVVRLADVDVDSVILTEARRLATHDNSTGKEAAWRLLSAIGSREAQSDIEEHSLTPEWYQQRLMEFAGDPCKSLYAWRNDEERLRCLERGDIGVYRLLNEAKLLLIDATIAVPEFRVAEALQFLRGINPAAVRASSSHTQESHLLDLLTPILCAYRPRELGEFMRAVVKTMPSREITGQYFLAMHLPEISLLLGQSEVSEIYEAIKTISISAPEWSDKNLGGPLNLAKHAEARAFSAIAPHLTSSDLFNGLVARSENAFDVVALELWFAPLPAGDAESISRFLRETSSPASLRRILWAFPYLDIALSPEDRESLLRLADSDDASLRASAVSVAVTIQDESLARSIIELGRHADKDHLWEEQWLTRLLARFGGHLSLDEIAMRLRPSAMGFVVVERGGKDEEVDLLSECLDEEWTRIVGASDPPIDGLPEVFVETDPVSAAVLPELRDPDQSMTIRYIDPGSSWKSVPPSSRDSGLRKAFEDWNDPEGKTRELNMDRRRRVEAILAAWRTEAYQWFGRTFSVRALERVYQRHPELVKKWIRPALDGSPAGVSARRRLAAFLGPVCLVLLNQNPSLGLQLWHALRVDNENPALVDTSEIAFIASDSPQSDEARRTVLDEATDDTKLASLAATCGRCGREKWLEGAIQGLIQAERLWRKAKGLTLASLSDIDRLRFEELVRQADLEATWVEDQCLTALRENIRTNQIARHWYSQFLSLEGNEAAWGAVTITLSVADERLLNWYTELENIAADPERAARRRRFLELGWNSKRSLPATVDRESERKDRLFGIKFQRGEIVPFM
jgi:hypothetical protein